MELLEIAKKAMENAYAPYSKFKVGAAIVSKSGKVYIGCNVENASYGATCCAERVALFKAISEGERDFESIAIYASENPAYPCGICRQVLSEFSPNIKILVDGDETDLKALLPKSFSLKKEEKE